MTDLKMDDLEQYIEKRKKEDPKFAEGFEEGFGEFKQRVLAGTGDGVS